MKKILVFSLTAISAMFLSACNSTNGACPTAPCAKVCPAKCSKDCPCPVKGKANCPQKKCCPKAKACKQLTKDMFYKNGKFDEAAAKQAYFDMLENLGYPVSENLRKNMWVIDFGLGEFPAVGMAGIFWAHENKHGVFGHEIFLLPNQFLVEHAHNPFGGLPAKNECWHCRAGVSYCFGEEGEMADTELPNVKVPESQKKFVTVHRVTPACSKKGNIVWLNRIGAKHYQIAGPQGAVVTEYGSFHQNEGNVFTNPNVKF